MRKQLLLFVLMLLTMAAKADESGKCGANLYYNYNATFHKFTISGEGPMWNIEDYDEYPWRNLKVDIIEIESGVTSIGDFAFSRFGITSVTIPNSVKSIGVYAFLFCGNLASVTIPNSVSSISLGAFQGCGNLTRVISEIENPFEIDNTVFAGISSDAKLIVPKGTIGKYKATAGWNFTNIVEATGSERGDYSDNGLFYNLKSDGTLEVAGLASWTTIADIPSSITIYGTKYRVTSIGEYAFEGRSDITYLSIPYSIKSIGKYAFIDCGSNMTVNIADPESWCQMELGNEHASPLSSAGKMLVHDIETDRIDIPETVTSIGAFTFYQCSCINSLNIPGSVKSIDSSAFEDCNNLTSLTLSEGLQSIGGSAFEECKRLTTLTIPSNVNTIMINAFKNCTSLTNVISEIENPFAIDGSVFDGIPSNTQLIVPRGTKAKYQATAGWNKFTNIAESSGKCGKNVSYFYEGTTHTLTIFGEGEMDNYSLMESDERPWRGYIKEIHTLKIESGVSTIGNYAFDGCSGLASVAIPSSVTDIRGFAFNGCSGLNSVTIPSSVTRIGSFSVSGRLAFGNCKSLNSVTIPNSVTVIGDEAFSGCSSLNCITMGYGIREIDSSAFSGTAWYHNQPNGLLYLDNYLLGYKGEKTNGVIAIRKGTKILANFAFNGCNGLTSITIPNSVTSIGGSAFSGCSGLSSIVSEIESPFVINNYVFNGVPSNARLIVPKGTKAKYQATAGWNQFTNIVEEGSVVEGDVNGDGVVNETDVNDVVTYILGKTPTGFNKDAADIIKDDKVNATDIVLINIIIKRNR